MLLASRPGPRTPRRRRTRPATSTSRSARGLDTSLDRPRRGPVSFVRVSFRITTPDTSALAISLVSPDGTEVPLVVDRGTGADFGSGDEELRRAPHRPRLGRDDEPDRGRLVALHGQPVPAGGGALPRSTARTRAAAGPCGSTNSGAPATLHCFTLDISRDVPQTLSRARRRCRARRSPTSSATSSSRSSASRSSAPAGRRSTCRSSGWAAGVRREPSGRRSRVRDLDGGEPEVLVDLYSGGAHCCLSRLILRYDAGGEAVPLDARRTGATTATRLVDLDRDGRARVLGLRRAVRLHVHRLRVLGGADPDLELPAGDARRRHPEVPGGDQKDAASNSRLLPEGPRPEGRRRALVRRRLRRRRVPARPAGRGEARRSTLR